MIIGFLVFFLFLIVVCLSVWAILRSDTNTDDTEFSLAIARFTVSTGKFAEAIRASGISFQEATQAFCLLRKAFTQQAETITEAFKDK